MSWERRKDNWYYTRSRRENGRVVRTYFGCGPEAEKAAADDVQRPEKLKQERRKWELKWAERVKLEALIDQYDAMVDLFFRAEMACRGYHYHRGEWRKRRGIERKTAEWEAARREREQQASAAEPQGPAKRRSVPLGRERDCGQGLVRSLKNCPVMTRLRERSSAAPCRTPDLSAQRRRGPTVVISLRDMFRLAERDAYDGSAARPPPDQHAC